MKSEYLLEIGCENLPSGYIGGALEQLRACFESGLSGERIEFDSLAVSGTPNRLVAHVKGIATQQSSSVETVPGPPVSVAIDGEGKFTKAAAGFARREGVAPEDLERISTERGEYLAIVRKITGKDTGAVLSEMVPGWISGIRFPKVMKWEESGFRFARPVRWILSLFGDRVLEFRVGPVTSAGVTRLSPYFEQFVGIDSVAQYFDTLSSAGIVLDQEERKRTVAGLAAKAATEAGGRLVEDDELCGMVANLVESPVVMSGSFDPGFLRLPREVIVTALKSHQRYFSVEDAEGNLKPSFIAFADGATRNAKEITRGYERVLQARLADAGFYFHEDSSRPIEEMADKLRDIVWLEGLGTLREKSERIASLASKIIAGAGMSGGEAETYAGRAAQLIKADIASEMVKDGKEFTLLQGYIGREYSRISGEPEVVSEAIYEHYFPRFSGDRLPEGQTGTVLSLADRFDTIAGCFIQGLGPTGSQDPYALRRHAISILRILIEKRIELGIDRTLRESFSLFVPGRDGSRKDEMETLRLKAMELFGQRLLGMLRSEGFDHDL
ncbi:MAG TPA: glycine--tRNA ligase subunit beta, partial [Candidatus Krumholzibacterium sp.]|nr:glycine--tRNA ligase subunit beta [Candidatus Krumholzibacterium sp.]